MLHLHKWQIDTKTSNKSWLGLSAVGRKLKPLRWWAGAESAVEERRVRRAKQGSKRKTAAKGQSGDDNRTGRRKAANREEGAK